MTARRLYARIIVGSLKGMAVGFGIGLVIGPFTGYLVMSLAYALADEPPDPNGSPGLAAAPFIFAFWEGSSVRSSSVPSVGSRFGSPLIPRPQPPAIERPCGGRSSSRSRR